MIRMMLMAGIGGFVGTCGRFLVGKLCTTMFHGSFPLGTFLVNIVGCFIIGLLFGLMERSNVLSTTQSALLITGFCGGFTTFSTFANDLFLMGSKGDWVGSAIYLILSIAVGIAMVWLGRALMH